MWQNKVQQPKRPLAVFCFSGETVHQASPAPQTGARQSETHQLLGGRVLHEAGAMTRTAGTVDGDPCGAAQQLLHT